MTKLLDTRAAADVLGISARHLRVLVARAEMPVVRIGRRVLFAPDSLEAFVRSRERPARADADRPSGREPRSEEPKRASA